jgi:hypothetical protein
MRLAPGQFLAALICLHSGSAAFGWGPEGHELIGLAAEPLLCRAAVSEIDRLGNGESLAELGQWADRVRSQPAYAHSAPWHYVNIPDDGDPRRPRTTSEGNVIDAIERFSRVLSSADSTPAQRRDALRFLVHFIADLHQPLHVGREEDRGGNFIDVNFPRDVRNLHYFWDTSVIRLKGLRTREYADSIGGRVRTAARRDRGTQVRDWAEQVFALRGSVYDFNTVTGYLDDEYLEIAEALAEQQLVLAAAHLANSLNEIFCR